MADLEYLQVKLLTWFEFTMFLMVVVIDFILVTISLIQSIIYNVPFVTLSVLISYCYYILIVIANFVNQPAIGVVLGFIGCKMILEFFGECLIKKSSHLMNICSLE